MSKTYLKLFNKSYPYGDGKEIGTIEFNNLNGFLVNIRFADADKYCASFSIGVPGVEFEQKEREGGVGIINNWFEHIEANLRMLNLRENQITITLSCIKEMVETNEKNIPKTWCEHIKWNNNYDDYSFDCMNTPNWLICPLCKKERPE